MAEKIDDFFDIMKALVDLKEKITGFENSFEDGDDEEQEKDPIKDSLQNDYNGCWKWAFGIEATGAYTKKQLQNAWEKLHPNKILPRAFRLKRDLPRTDNQIILLMDIFPQYLESNKIKIKSNSCGC